MTAGFILIAVGVVILFWCNKRAFDRRNLAGVQEFRSYGHSVGTRSLELVAKVAGWFLILGGLGRFVMVMATGH